MVNVDEKSYVTVSMENSTAVHLNEVTNLKWTFYSDGEPAFYFKSENFNVDNGTGAYLSLEINYGNDYDAGEEISFVNAVIYYCPSLKDMNRRVTFKSEIEDVIKYSDDWGMSDKGTSISVTKKLFWEVLEQFEKFYKEKVLILMK